MPGMRLIDMRCRHRSLRRRTIPARSGQCSGSDRERSSPSNDNSTNKKAPPALEAPKLNDETTASASGKGLSNAETRDGHWYRVLRLLPMGGKSPCISASRLNTHRVRSTNAAGWPAELDLVCRWYRPHLERIHEDATLREADLLQLSQIASTYPSRERFLTELTLDPPGSGRTASR